MHPVSFVIALSVVVYLHVVLGEMIPKNIALAGPDRAALVLGPPIWGIVTVLRPVVVVINAIASVVLRLLGAKLTDEVSSTFTREEVAALVEESRGEGLLEADEYDRLAGALGFTEKTVGSVLMPPGHVDDRATRLLRRPTSRTLCAATGYSRFPVVDDDGSLLGYLHIKDVLEPDEQRRQRPLDDKWIRPFAPIGPDEAAPRRTRGAAAPRRPHGAWWSTRTAASTAS